MNKKYVLLLAGFVIIFILVSLISLNMKGNEASQDENYNGLEIVTIEKTEENKEEQVSEDKTEEVPDNELEEEKQVTEDKVEIENQVSEEKENQLSEEKEEISDDQTSYDHPSDDDYYDSSNDTSYSDNDKYEEYKFRSQNKLQGHYEKHGIDMGFDSAEDYEKAASDVVNNPEALHKIEKEDGDDVYYIEDTNEFVIVSSDGYIRTYFNPNDGIDYYYRQ
ncbi:MAG: hypothetical protein K6E10_11320 [Eubacterium sp.]|nr:hypothetical protein [Eubacterium sp.]